MNIAEHYQGLDAPPTTRLEFDLEGVSCASCVGRIERAVNDIVGVDKALINFAQRTIAIEGNINADTLITTISNIGYGASIIDANDAHLQDKEIAEQVRFKRLIWEMTVALALGIPLMLYGLAGGPMSVETSGEQISWLIIGLLCAAIMIYSGKHFFVGAYKAVRAHSANMDTLIVLGTTTAWLYSMVVVLLPAMVPPMARHLYFEAAVMIIGLINLGLALEIKARGRTSQAIKRLIGLKPKTARVIRQQAELDIPIEAVEKDDYIRIRPGETIPVDGIVLEGQTHINESMLTGEPMPVAKQALDEVSAGTLNTSGSIIFKATRVGKDTALARIIDMVKQAQNAKLPIGRLADSISGIFVPMVMIIAVISGLVWLNFGPQPTVAYALVVVTTVLIIACPCALGLATPMSVMVGIGKAAESGVLIRNGEALQTASKISVMVLDKTGTITEGTPKVSQIITLNDFSRRQVVQLAASLESASEHPLAKAIIAEAQAEGISTSPVEEFSAIAGHGVSGRVGQHQLLFGNQKLLEDHQIGLDGQVSLAQRLAAQAKTPVYLAVNGRLAAIIAIADPVKADSAAAIKRLQNNGIKVVMLTGDNNETAAAIAQAVNITEYYGQVLPQDKANKVMQLQQQGKIVGMVGDGINDAPALAAADVGFAIGGGTDVAIESADITLMRDSLHGLGDAIAVSKATLSNIKQNLIGAFVYNVLGITFAAGLFYPISGLLLNPVIAGMAMAFSSVTVVSNANRLRFFKAQEH